MRRIVKFWRCDVSELEVHGPHMVCTDCLLFITNGYLPEHDEDEGRVLMGAGLEVAAGRRWVAGDGENDHEFSWRPCPHCGTTLGGSRHEAFYFTKARQP